MTQELKEIYSNINSQEVYYDAFKIVHPNFTSNILLIKANENKIFTIDGSPATFLAYPIGCIVPSVGDDQQDFGIMLDNVSQDVIEQINLASLNPEIPISVTYYVFIDSDTVSQITPLTLVITSLNANLKTIQATATRSDLYARHFPFGATSYFDQKYVGLYL